MNNPTRAPRHVLTNLDKDSRTADCSICGTNWPVRIRSNGRGECMTQRRRNRRGTPEKAKAARARSHDNNRVKASRAIYGWVGELDVAGYERMLEAQSGGCAICGALPTERRLAIDHDHASGAVRGLLCMVCNVVLGRFKDDAPRFSAAARYLRGHSA